MPGCRDLASRSRTAGSAIVDAEPARALRTDNQGEGSRADDRCPGSRLRTQPSGPSVGRGSSRPGRGHGRRDGHGHGRRRRRRRAAGLALHHVPLRRELRPGRPCRRIPAGSRLVKPVDPSDPKVAETIAAWADTEGTVAIRIMMTQGVSTDAADPGINRVLAAAARHSLPVNLLCWGRLEQVGQLAARNPDTQAGDRPSRAAAAVRAAGAGGALRRAAEAAGARRPRQHRGQDQRRLHAVATSRFPTRTSGIRSAASSTPSASIAACGGRTGPGRSAC